MLRTHWEDGWPNHGLLKFGYSSQLDMRLLGNSNFSYKGGESDEVRNHPAVKNCNAQDATLEWGFDKEYRICRKCQKDFIDLVGQFIGLIKNSA